MTSQCKKKQGNDVTNTNFCARPMLFTVGGPQVDTLIYCRRLKFPTLFKEPCPLGSSRVGGWGVMLLLEVGGKKYGGLLFI